MIPVRVFLLVGFVVQQKHHDRDASATIMPTRSSAVPRNGPLSIASTAPGVHHSHASPDSRDDPSPHQLPTLHRAPVVLLDPHGKQGQLPVQFRLQTAHLSPEIGNLGL
jgi:hypothetical protein